MSVVLTDARWRAARAIAAAGPVSPRQLARLLWPESNAWQRRTRRRGTNVAGALGGTMPMKAGGLLWRMRAVGLAEVSDVLDAPVWTLTLAGERVAEGRTLREARSLWRRGPHA